MAKITMTLCDVSPCTYLADREFEVNGQTVYVCGENCFVKFWSREYRNWKKEHYHMKAHIHVDQKSSMLKGVILNETPGVENDLHLINSDKTHELKYIPRVQR